MEKETKNAEKMSVGIPEGKRPFGRGRCMERMVLKWILKKRDVKVHNAFNWLITRSSGGML